MLSEQRYEMILKILEEKRSVTVTELTRLLDISESTARRDIVVLDKAGKLVRCLAERCSRTIFIRRRSRR